MPATESDERAGSKDGSDNGCSTPNAASAAARGGKTDHTPKTGGNINSKPGGYQETNNSSSPVPPAPAPAAAGAAAGAAATPTRADEPGPTKPPADLLKTAERAEFGSSPVAYRGSFGRGYEHRRRGGGYRQSTFLPPPPPQAPGVGGGAGWTGLRDLDGYTSSAEADIESMASFASHDSREVRERERASRTQQKTYCCTAGYTNDAWVRRCGCHS